MYFSGLRTFDSRCMRIRLSDQVGDERNARAIRRTLVTTELASSALREVVYADKKSCTARCNTCVAKLTLLSLPAKILHAI